MLRSLEWIAAHTGGSIAGSVPESGGDIDVALSTTDSRECGPGSLYFARIGENSDGHDFADSAASAGAGALVVQRRLDVDVPQIVVQDSTLALGMLAKAHLADLRAGGDVLVAGITGSAGKTTTKDLLAAILGATGPTVAPVASLNNEVGCPLTVLKADRQTRFLVLEMGASGRGHLAYLTDIAPLDAAVELMVGRAHLGGFGSVEILAESKRELVEGLVPGGTAVLNADDPLVAQMAQVAPGPVLFFSARGREDSQVRATGGVLDRDGCPSFVLETPDFRGRVNLRIAGMHQIGNALAAIACNAALGCSTINAVRVLEHFSAVSPHRMSLRRGIEFATKAGKVTISVLDDAYNANPDSMVASFRAAGIVRDDGRMVMVLGEMLELGEQSAAIHAEVGEAAAASRPDVMITVGSGAMPMAAALEADVVAHHVSDHSAAVDALREILQEGDFVLLKGSLGSGVWRVADALNGTA